MKTSRFIKLLKQAELTQMQLPNAQMQDIRTGRVAINDPNPAITSAGYGADAAKMQEASKIMEGIKKNPNIAHWQTAADGSMQYVKPAAPGDTTYAQRTSERIMQGQNFKDYPARTTGQALPPLPDPKSLAQSIPAQRQPLTWDQVSAGNFGAASVASNGQGFKGYPARTSGSALPPLSNFAARQPLTWAQSTHTGDFNTNPALAQQQLQQGQQAKNEPGFMSKAFNWVKNLFGGEQAPAAPAAPAPAAPVAPTATTAALAKSKNTSYGNFRSQANASRAVASAGKPAGTQPAIGKPAEGAIGKPAPQGKPASQGSPS